MSRPRCNVFMRGGRWKVRVLQKDRPNWSDADIRLARLFCKILNSKLEYKNASS